MNSFSSFYRWLIVVFLIFMALLYIDWNSILDEIEFKHFITILVVQPIQFFLIFILAVRFSFLVISEKVAFSICFQAYILSIGLNSFLPGRISEFVKISYLKEWGSVPIAYSTVALFMERVIDVFFLAVCLLFGVGSLWIEIDNDFIFYFFIFLFFCFFVLFFVEKRMNKIISIFPKSRFLNILNNVFSACCELIKSKGFFVAVSISMVTWFGSYFFVYIFLKLLYGADIDVNAALLIFSAMAIGRSIPGLPGGLGTYEAAIVFSMDYLGFGFSESFVTAVTLHASQLIFVTLAALIIMGKNGLGIMSVFRNIRGENEY